MTLHIVDAGQVDRSLSANQVNILAGPDVPGRILPLMTISPPGEVSSVVADAVNDVKSTYEAELSYLWNGPEKRLIYEGVLANLQPQMLWCWSNVSTSDPDVPHTRDGKKVDQPEAFWRINLVQAYTELIPATYQCKVPVMPARLACYINKDWVAWYQATHSKVSGFFSIVDLCTAALPGGMNMISTSLAGPQTPKGSNLDAVQALRTAFP